MKTRPSIIQLVISTLVQITLLAACVFDAPMDNSQKPKFPVLFDPRFSFEINAIEKETPFPFKVGDIVEVHGLLVYHGVPEWIRNEVLEEAAWSATLYPTGGIISQEEMALRLRGISKEADYEVIWGADHDVNLLLVSDRPAPPELFVNPRPGDSREVCISMSIDELDQEQVDGYTLVRIVLRPIGEKNESLTQSTIRACGDSDKGSQ